jgi:hemerythrin
MAKFVERSDDRSVGIEEIDDQHKVLTDLIDEMHDVIPSATAARWCGTC